MKKGCFLGGTRPFGLRRDCRDPLPMREVGLQLSLHSHREAARKRRLKLSDISSLAQRFPPRICSMAPLDVSCGLRTNTAFLV